MRARAALAGLAIGVLCGGVLAGCGHSSSTTSSAASSTASSPSGGSATTSSAGPATGSPIHFALVTFKIPGGDFVTPWSGGANAAADYVNAHGGIDGHKVIIDLCNGQLTPASDTECANKTLMNDPIAEFGCDTAWSTSGAPIYEAHHVPTMNCASSPQDYTNPGNYGIGGGSEGENGSLAHFICSTFPNAKTVAVMSPADPGNEATFPAALNPILAQCGITVKYTYIPFTVVDVAPYVTKIVESKPGVVLDWFGGPATQATLQAFKSYNYPMDHLVLTSTDLDAAIINPAKSLLDGVYFSSEIVNWSETSDPNVQAYLQQTANVSDNQNQNVEWGWLEVMWLVDAAKKIGAASLTPATMAHYLATTNNTPIALSRMWINPGPAKYPSIHQPYTQILQFTNGALTVVQKDTQSGWVEGLTTG